MVRIARGRRWSRRTVTFHRNLAFSLAALLVAGAVWAAVEALRSSSSPLLAAYFRVIEGVIAIEVGFGLVLWARGGHPRGLHLLYGAVILAPLPLAGSLWRRRGGRGVALTYVAACAIALLALLRLTLTA